MTRRAGADQGAAVVDFVLVVVLLLTLFLGVFQVGVFFHVRNIVIAAAAEGARYGANADRTPEDGAQRASEAIAGALGDRVAAGIRCEPGSPDQTVDGSPVVDIDCHGRVPSVFFLGDRLTLDVHGHSLEESR